MKRYDSMGFESEWGIYVRWADADAEIALVTKQRDIANQQLARFIDAAAAAFAKRDAVPQGGVDHGHATFTGPGPNIWTHNPGCPYMSAAGGMGQCTCKSSTQKGIDHG